MCKCDKDQVYGWVGYVYGDLIYQLDEEFINKTDMRGVIDYSSVDNYRRCMTWDQRPYLPSVLDFLDFLSGISILVLQNHLVSELYQILKCSVSVIWIINNKVGSYSEVDRFKSHENLNTNYSNKNLFPYCQKIVQKQCHAHGLRCMISQKRWWDISMNEMYKTFMMAIRSQDI